MNNDSIKSRFEDLDVWKRSRELRVELSKMVRLFPIEEKYRLQSQIIRASRSVTNNIAEGYGRFHYQENIQFCRQARGSLYELLDHIIIASDENYININSLNSLSDKIFIIIRTLNGYISYLKRQKDS